MTLRNGLQCGLCIALTFGLGGLHVLAEEEAWCTESTSGTLPPEYYLHSQTGTCASRQISGELWECCHNFTKVYTNGSGGWVYITARFTRPVSGVTMAQVGVMARTVPHRGQV